MSYSVTVCFMSPRRHPGLTGKGGVMDDLPALSRREVARFLVTMAIFIQLGCAGALAAETTAETATPAVQKGDAAEYHTPLAGAPGIATFLGRSVAIPARDRSHLTSLTLGGTLLFPQQGTLPGVPVAALYLRRVEEGWRTRDVIGIFDNELEYDRRFGRFELVGQFDDYTIPGDTREVVDNREIRGTGVAWGNLMAGVGPGIRIPVPPFEIDNDLRLQLLGRVGYMYASRDDETGPDVVVPPSTMLYGGRLRGRYDGMRRNVLELPHRGIATGFDLDFVHRDHWRDLTPGGGGSVHNNFFQWKGYIVGAGGIPGLSERDRVLFNLGAGSTTGGRGDRFNAFLINGGPFPSEADDMGRSHYSGIIYQDVRATSYGTASLAYRRELTFFLYLSLIGSYIWADRATVVGADQVVFRERSDVAGAIALDSAFLWNSSLNLSYSWDSGFIRGGRSGAGFTLLWNKCFD
jgi:hypothetical protein